MAATGITAAKNALVALIAAGWNPAAPDAVTGVGRIDANVSELTGRKVYVFRSARTDTSAARGEDQHDYEFVIWIIEVYPGTDDPPESWIDTRVSFAEWLLELVGDTRGARLLETPGVPGSGLWPETAELTTVYDVQDLTQYKAFSSVITVTYREQTTET